MAKTEPNKTTINRTRSRIPHFKTVAEAAEFWDSHDSAEVEDEFKDVSDVQFVVARARPKKWITIRIGEIREQPSLAAAGLPPAIPNPR